LARQAGLKEETVRRLEKAAGNPTESTVSRILGALEAAGVEFLADERRRTIGVRLRWA
jgi:DNA-binding phage protein